ncbi:hypothetical protein [Streptomyces sp. NPDC017673]|uniref:hypothetical protein n=1 Tax=unclassified Streptomyces TaxID=2593676 RepID=UPI003789106E
MSETTETATSPAHAHRQATPRMTIACRRAVHWSRRLQALAPDVTSRGRIALAAVRHDARRGASVLGVLVERYGKADGHN